MIAIVNPDTYSNSMGNLKVQDHCCVQASETSPYICRPVFERLKIEALKACVCKDECLGRSTDFVNSDSGHSSAGHQCAYGGEA